MRYAYANCRSCGARMQFAWTNEDRRMPLNDKPSPEGTFYVFRTEEGRPECEHHKALTYRATDARKAGAPKYLPHFATCTNPSAHRLAKRDAQAKT